MGSQVLEISRQGIWASLTGGWFYDPHQNLFSNTFHLYLWLFLLCFPFTLYMCFLPTLMLWGTYCGVVAVLFTVIKVTNYRLHGMFDTSECLQDSTGSSSGSSSNGSSSNCSKSGDHGVNTKESSPGLRRISNHEGIEMQTLNSKRTSSTPPVQCSSRNSLTEDELVGHQHLDSTSVECRCFPPLNPVENGTKSRSSTIDLKVDVHRNNSSGSSEDGLMKPIVESAMVVMAEEENVPENPEERFEELYETAAGNASESTSNVQQTDIDDMSEKVDQEGPTPEKSISHQQSSGSLTTVSSVSANDVSGARRYSNLSNLALSRPNSYSASSAILKETGSLELGLVMENVCARQRFCFSRQARRERDKKLVRRSRSALETGPSPHSHPGGLETLDNNGGSFHASRRGSGVGKVVTSKGAAAGRNSEFFLRSSFSEDINPIVESKDELPSHSGASQCSGSQIDVIGNCGVQDLPIRMFNKGTDWGTIWGGFLARHQSFDAGTPGNCDRLNSSQNGHKPVSRRSLSGRPGMEENKLLNSNEIVELQMRPFRTSTFKASSNANVDLQSSNLYNRTSTNSNSSPGILPVTSETESKFNSIGIISSSGSAVNETQSHSHDVDSSKAESEEAVTPINAALPTTSKDDSSGPASATSNLPTVLPPPFLPFDVVGVPSREKAKCSSSFSNKHQSNSDVLQQPALCQSIVSRTSLKLPVGTVLSSAELCALDSLFSPDDETSIASSCDEEVIAYFRKLERAKPPIAEGESIVGSVPSDLSIASPSTPCDNWSARTRSSQGAIPKRKPPHLSPEDPQASSEKRPSINHADTDVDHRLLRRRLFEILYRPELAEAGESSRTQDGDLSRITEKSVELEVSTENKEDTSTEKTTSSRHGKAGGHRRRHHASGSHSAISNTSAELSSLLPSTVTSGPCLQRSLERSRNQWRMGSGSASSSLVPRDRSQGPPLTAIASMLSSPGAHLASSHDDTTTGAVHCFQDERGNWLMYSFDENSSGVATDLVSLSNSRLLQTAAKTDAKWEASSHLSSASSSIGILEEPCDVIDINDCFPRAPRRAFPFLGALQDFRSRQIVGIPMNEVTLSHGRSSQGGTDTDVSSTEKLRFDEGQRKPKYFYKFFPIPCKFIKVRFDRLALLAMLDRNLSITENMLVIFLAALVGALGGLLLSAQYFYDFWIFLFCFVVASCQYSLIKSVQPDAASPIHGYNRVVAFSRPIYFCICCILVIILQYCLDNGMYNTAFTLYGLPFTSRYLMNFFKDFLLVFILCFPIIFSFGLLPQINTFLMYFCEQLDMHMFGGNAVTSLTSAFYCVIRSILSVCVLYGFAYGGLREPMSSQHIMFSIFCGMLVPLCYHLSRSASDPSVLWSIVKSQIWSDEEKDPNVVTAAEDELLDPLPSKMRNTVLNRLRSDVIICPLMGILVFAVHVSTVFTTLQPLLSYILYCIATVFGIVVHYVIPQMRKQLPWLFCSHPLCKSHEYRQFEVRDAAKIMWFERLYAWLWFVERNIVYPVVFLSVLTRDSPYIIKKFGVFGGSLVVVIASLKCLRFTFSDAARQHQVLIFTVLFFHFDYRNASETFLIDYFIMSTVLSKSCSVEEQSLFLIFLSDLLLLKFYEFVLKIRFVITYIAPWQITWGSAFHAFAQPFSVPHSAMLFLQAAISAILSTPLNPVLGSAIFITSYVRPVKFWERDYNTKRVDHTNTRLSTHLERNPGADDNNLNSIFYEHLARSLQHSLCGDLMLGRWGNVSQGDCFVLASDYLNCLVHITELANGLVSFQVRGLEFRGTYCQQREVEAISEGVDEDDGCCCCEPGHLPHALSVNAAFNQRWLAWEVIVTKYVLEGYSISDNSAASMFQVFDLRKVLITYYVKSIIYYILQSSKLEEWLSMDAIVDAVQSTLDKNYADVDPVFNMNVDEDYDFRAAGVSRNSFCNVYYDWIQFCAGRRENPVECGRDSVLVSLCFALSILGRRALGAAAHNYSSSVDFFLYGLHALFKGDFRITSVRDEWVFVDMEMLRRVVAPGVRMALKLHQDHFTSPDEYDDPQVLYSAISTHEQNLVISHEGDPAWRNAVLSNKPSLLALRHVVDDGSDEYKIIMLNKRYLSFRVIKINRECVRGLWAGQQQELVYLRNRNPERGSIQNAKQALRNLINSSCDQPIGYPIYVSPLTTSYADTNSQLCSVLGGSISFGTIQKAVLKFWCRMRRRCGESCSSGGSVPRDDICIGQDGVYSTTPCIAPSVNTLQSSNQNTSNSHSGDSSHTGGSSMGRGSLGRGTNVSVNRGSLISNMSSVGKPSSSTLASMAAGLLSETSSLRDLNREANGGNQNNNGNGGSSSSNSNSAPVITMTSFCTRSSGGHGNSNSNGVATSTVANSSTGKKYRHDSGPIHKVKIIDPSQVYDTINLGRRIDVQWPDESMRQKGGKNHWQSWTPEKGMEGSVVHRWVPCHKDPGRRSHVDRTIMLVKIDDKFVPIGEGGVQYLGAEV